jgi:hypothetical protein
MVAIEKQSNRVSAIGACLAHVIDEFIFAFFVFYLVYLYLV